ncbi:hypothetical protein FACUT_1428 [Fusarium acutatum]|uniref:Uncharacterized protein n=1 Tax=Fusarium acutatum TaxID=78861 RepID=A0A8H4NT60_9HYPO|nr:hypothetical protein FACUT_1428 [Fusarium acutatum]
MPVPKTDEEIMADWSPQEWEFHDWTEKNTDNILATMRQGAEWNAYQKFMKQAWPDPDVLEKYEEWAYNWHRRFFVRNKYHMNTEDFIEMVSQTNFLDTKKVERVFRVIYIYPKPFVAIGEANFGGVFTGYGFTPMTDFLEPKYTDSDPDVVGNIILAMNIHVPHSPPSSRVSSSSTNSLDPGSGPGLSVSTTFSYSFSTSASSQPNSPLWPESRNNTGANTPNSTISNEDFQTLRGVGMRFNNGPSSVFNTILRKKSYVRTTIPYAMKQTEASMGATSDPASHKFVFVQIGLLWSYTGDWEKVRDGNPNDDKRGRWNPTGYAVVVRLSPKGTPGEVYVLHHPNAKPKLKKFEDDYTGNRKSHKNKKKAGKRGPFLKHYVPGHPHPKSNSSFWIAKIADSIQDMGFYKREFVFDVISSEEPQIVNAKIWDYGLDGPTLIPVREPEDIDS